MSRFSCGAELVCLSMGSCLPLLCFAFGLLANCCRMSFGGFLLEGLDDLLGIMGDDICAPGGWTGSCGSRTC
jgi:hypothetical protein